MLIRLFIFCLIFFNSLAFAASKSADSATKQPAIEATASSVNINTADVKQLQQIKGIGTKRAQMIVDYRNKNGSFKSVNDLTKVKGISTKRLDKLEQKNPGKIVVK
jgi:competence protein ComEA